MNQARAEELASSFVEQRAGRKLKLIGARKAPKWPNEWNVLFETRTPDGNVMDGPTIVIVDEQSEAVRYFE